MKKEYFGLILICSVLAIGYLDFITPYEYSMALLYFIPIILSAMKSSAFSSYTMVFFVSGVWFLADYITPLSPMKSYSAIALIWIVTIKIVTLGTVAFAIIKTKRAMRALDKTKRRLLRLNEDLEQQVDLRTAKLRESVAELESFSHSLVHDMRAPLRAMHGYAEMLMADQCPDCKKTEAKEYLKRIISASIRLDALILDALNYSKIARGDVPLEPVDAGSLVREILESYPNMQNHRDEIVLEGDFPLVMANKAALTQCVSNLLGNAVKFISPETKLRVRVHAEKKGRMVRLWFEDNGIGIPPGWEKRIFLMFEQVGKGYEGTGVGLAIVRKAMERMGGEVGVEPNPGKGSRFWIQLAQAQGPQAQTNISQAPH